jgi:hypothetical protein
MAQGPRRPPRPPVVSILVLIFLFQTATFAAQLWLQLTTMGVSSLETVGTIVSAAWVEGDRWVDVLLSVGLLLLVIASIFTAIGLARMRPWAWLWAMTIEGGRLLIGLMAFLRGDPHTLSLLVPLIVVLLLDQAPVRRAFGVERIPHA